MLKCTCALGTMWRVGVDAELLLSRGNSSQAARGICANRCECHSTAGVHLVTGGGLLAPWELVLELRGLIHSSGRCVRAAACSERAPRCCTVPPCCPRARLGSGSDAAAAAAHAWFSGDKGGVRITRQFGGVVNAPLTLLLILSFDPFFFFSLNLQACAS